MREGGLPLGLLAREPVQVGQENASLAVRAAAEAELEQAATSPATAYKVAMVRNTTELALRRLADESFGEDA